MARVETFYDVIRRQGISRRSFLEFCSLTAASLGLAPAFGPRIAEAMETKPRIPVLWLHGLECTCCSGEGIEAKNYF
jgi:hydrogenase small subunit